MRPGSLGAFGGALRAARKAMGMTLEEVAGATGISKPYLSTIETGRTPGPPSEEKLRLMARVLGLEAEEVVMAADWLRTPAGIRGLVEEGGQGVVRRGDGAIDLDAMMKGSRSVGKGEAGVKTSTVRGVTPGKPGAMGLRVGEVPLINGVAAGGPVEFGDMGYPAGVGDAYVPTVKGEGEREALFAVKVVGDSMMPVYGEGEILLVGSGEASPGDGEDCVVRFSEGSNYATTFKRVYFVRDDATAATAEEATHVRLVPLNPKHEAWVVALEEVTGIYPVVWRLLRPKKGEAAGPKAEGRQFLLEED